MTSQYKINLSDSITEFVQLINDAKSMYDYCSEQSEKYDKLTSDFLHKFELDSLSSANKAKLGTALKQHLRERRYYKDRVEELEPFIKLLNENTSKAFVNGLTECLGKVRKQEAYHNCRTYIPRAERLSKSEVKSND